MAENNVKVIKFFLHISKQEQKKRLLERSSDPAKRWKVNEDDFKKRKKWDQYMQAYGDAISRCSTTLGTLVYPLRTKNGSVIGQSQR